MNILKISITPKKGFQHNNSWPGIQYHVLVALQQLSVSMLLSHSKYKVIYPLFSEGLAKLRLNFMVPHSNYVGMARTLKVSIEKMTKPDAQEGTGLSITKQTESLETEK